MALDGVVPYPDEFVRRYRDAGYWKGQTLGALMRTWASTWGARTALVDGPRRFSYAELDEWVDRLAAQLSALGFGANDRVVVHMPNVAEFIVVCFALFRIGALPVFALPAHREHELSYLCEFAEAKGYVVVSRFRDYDYQGLAHTLRERCPTLQHVLVVGGDVDEGFVSLDRLLEAAPDAAAARRGLSGRDPDPQDVALFLLSGGTTGLPKLIPRTHDDYAYNIEVSAEVCGLDASTVYLVGLPIAHNFPFGCPGVLGTLHNGGTAVMVGNPNPHEAFPAIEREGVTVTALVPALAIRWMDAAEEATEDLSSLELLQVGGARLNPAAARRVRPTLGCTVQQVFGMAEGLLNYTRPDDPEEVRVETQGRPASPGDEVLVVDEHDQPVPDGELGQLLTRGPYTIRGYYRAEEHNATAFTADGFYRSGDMVRWHSSGNLIVEGRDKDLINRGGEKISAEEIENLALTHPKVQNVAAVAMPDPALGERICMYVICRGAETLSLAELTEHMASYGLAKFKLPERLECVDQLPLTSVGKVAKNALRADVRRKVEQEGHTAGDAR